jgi:hypothetical protein
MLKQIFYLSVILLFSVGCAAKKPNNSSALVPHKLPKNISYSNGFKQFWAELETETRGLKSLSEYLPSNMMKNIYTFVEMPDGRQGIEGFIQVTPQYFDALTFEALGGYLVYFQEGIYQFKLPVESVVQVLDIKGLIQIDIPRKIRK